jgi:hypothetical protein
MAKNEKKPVIESKPNTQEFIKQLREKLLRKIEAAEADIGALRKFFAEPKKQQKVRRQKRRKK